MVKYFTYKFLDDNYGNFKLYGFSLSFFLLLNGNIQSQSLSAEQIYEKVKDAIVVIYAYDKSDELVSQGSGVVLKDSGYILTNYHVLSTGKFEIMRGNDEIPYNNIVSYNVEKDILIINITDRTFPSIKIGDVKSLKVGQQIYTIGNPMGLENTISEGIISGLRRYEESTKNYIQITASISPGSSGGAVLNDRGELIGISTSTISDGQNLNFAIPIDEILALETRNLSIESFRQLQLGLKWNEIRDISFKADSLYEIQDYPEAILLYIDALDRLGNISSYLDSMRASHYYANMSLSYCRIGNLDESYENYKQALDFECGFNFTSSNDFDEIASAYYNRGTMIAKLEDYIRAIQDFDISIEINPLFAEAYYNRGLAKYYLDDMTGACLDWRKAGELGNYDASDLIKEHCN